MSVSPNPPGDAAGAAPAQTPEVFARKASGLIRTASVFDVFSFNVLSGLIGISSLFILSLVPAFYPGANLPLATLIGGLEVLPLVFVYARLSAAYPRSGGDYVYMSRLVHPAFGFAANLGFTMAAIFVIAVGGAFTANYGIGPLLRVAGAYWSNHSLVNAGNWVTHPTGVFILGTAGILAFGALFIWGGMKVYWRVQLVIILMATLSLAIIAIWSLFVSRHTALTNASNELGHIGGKNLTPLADGKTPSFSLWETFKASVWPNFGIVGVLFSAYIGGEVKRPAKNQMAGMLTALVWSTAWMAAIGALMVSLFGIPFWANLTTADLSHYGLSWVPGYEEIAGLGLGNGVVAVITLALFSAWGVSVVALNIAICSRTMFAWSMDRVVPAWFSRVSARSHVPYNAILSMMAVGIIFTAALAWKWITVLGGSYGFFIAFGGASICAILFAHRNPALWKASPGNTRTWGVPTTAWWGLVGLLFGVAFLIYLLCTDLIAAITPGHNFGQFIVFPGIVVAGFIGYYVARAVRRRQGIDLDLNFKEIPPD
jgi:APA family basic amino acid/polyamine antiporter